MDKQKIGIRYTVGASYFGAVGSGVFLALFVIYAIKGIFDLLLLAGIILGAALAVLAGISAEQDKQYLEYEYDEEWEGK